MNVFHYFMIGCFLGAAGSAVFTILYASLDEWRKAGWYIVLGLTLSIAGTWLAALSGK